MTFEAPDLILDPFPLTQRAPVSKTCGQLGLVRFRTSVVLRHVFFKSLPGSPLADINTLPGSGATIGVGIREASSAKSETSHARVDTDGVGYTSSIAHDPEPIATESSRRNLARCREELLLAEKFDQLRPSASIAQTTSGS